MPRSENEAIHSMLEDAETWGYGNFINRLQQAWQKMLQSRHGLNEEAAKFASWQMKPLYDRIDKLEDEMKQLQSALMPKKAVVFNTPIVVIKTTGKLTENDLTKVKEVFKDAGISEAKINALKEAINSLVYYLPESDNYYFKDTRAGVGSERFILLRHAMKE